MVSLCAVIVVGAVVSVLWLRERLGSLTGEGFLDVVPFVHVVSERYFQLFARENHIFQDRDMNGLGVGLRAVFCDGEWKSEAHLECVFDRAIPVHDGAVGQQ